MEELCASRLPSKSFSAISRASHFPQNGAATTALDLSNNAVTDTPVDRASLICPPQPQTRPPSRLPRPTSAATPLREPVNPGPILRTNFYARHKLKMSLTVNDLASLQEQEESSLGAETTQIRRLSMVASASIDERLAPSPSKLPRLVAFNACTTSRVERYGKNGERRFVSTPVSLPSYKKEVSWHVTTSHRNLRVVAPWVMCEKPIPMFTPTQSFIFWKDNMLSG